MITSQVTHCSGDIQSSNLDTPLPASKKHILEEDCFLHAICPEGTAWKSFLDGLLKTTMKSVPGNFKFDTTFLIDLENHLPSFTPEKSGTIVYTRIEESQASSVEDVSNLFEKVER